MRITGAQVFDLQEGFVQRDICFDGRLLSGSSADGKTYDASGCYVIPGLTDVHFHGAKGFDFSDGDADGLAAIAEYELSRGVTQICPAGMTLLPEQLEKICAVAAAHRAAKRGGADLSGINLEGPKGRSERRLAPGTRRGVAAAAGGDLRRAGEAGLRRPGAARRVGVHPGRGR